MSNTGEFDFSEFNRQNSLGVIIMFVQSVRRAINAFLALFAVSFASKGINPWTGTAVGFILIYIAITSFLKYKNFRFKISESSLVLNSGILTKEVINIPFERIQSVHISQNFVQRILRINGLKIDTAGSGTQELEIPALSRKKSEVFLAELESRMSLSRKETEEETVSNESALGEPEKEPSEIKTEETVENTKLVSLDLKGLSILAITENHIRNGLLAVAFIFGYAQQYVDITEEYVYDLVDDSDIEILQGSLAAVLAFIIIFLLISILISFIRVMTKFWDFKAELNPKAFLVKSGLFKRNEYTIPRKKIQFLEWRTNILRKRLGFESIKIYQGTSDENSVRNSIEIPACYSHQTNLVMDSLYPEHDSEEGLHLISPHKFQIRYRAVVFSLLSIGLFLVVAFETENFLTIGVSYLVWVGIIIWGAKRYYSSVNLWINDDLMIYERGWLFKKRTVLPLYKIQAIDITQSIFHVKREICHLSFSTAAGERRLRFFDIDEMQELRDFLLYKSESHEGSWM